MSEEQLVGQALMQDPTMGRNLQKLKLIFKYTSNFHLLQGKASTKVS
jgi:hypothetical protein